MLEDTRLWHYSTFPIASGKLFNGEYGTAIFHTTSSCSHLKRIKVCSTNDSQKCVSIECGQPKQPHHLLHQRDKLIDHEWYPNKCANN